MPLLINLRVLNVGDLDVPYKCRDLDAIMNAVSTLQHLQLLKYASYPLPEDSPALQRLNEIEITSEDVDTLRNCSFVKKVVRFATPLRSLTSVDTPLIKGFPNLRELSLGEYWSSPEELCTALEAVPKLTHLRVKLSVDLNYRYNPKHSYRPTNLTRLSHLTITFREGYRFMDDDALYWLVESIVGQSYLCSLGIMWYNLKTAKTRCEKLLQHLFARHGRTLQKLKLPFFHMSKTTFQRLAKRMPCLTQLWIGATPQMKTWLPNMICTFTKLERLRLYNLDECGFPFSLSFLQQACPTLKVIKVCQRPDYFIARNTPFLRYAWKSNWVYETPIGSNKRIKGPMKAHQLSAVGRRYNHQDSAYASDSGSDMDFG
ncbi:hypothetical protein FS842_003074 [Serendipita sp. 407]|nr:hypothetical protein FS842_003074 [Serendipita sp. 407]